MLPFLLFLVSPMPFEHFMQVNQKSNISFPNTIHPSITIPFRFPINLHTANLIFFLILNIPYLILDNLHQQILIFDGLMLCNNEILQCILILCLIKFYQ